MINILSNVFTRTQLILLKRIMASALFVVCAVANAQNKNDSLLAIWKNTSNADTVRLWALDKICEATYFLKPDTAIILTQQEYDFAKERNLKKFMARAYLKKSAAYMTIGDFEKCLYCNRVALILTRELRHKKGIANCITNIGSCYKAKGDDIKALRCYFTTLQIFKSIPNGQEGVAITLSNLSDIYQRNGQIDSAISMLKQSLAIHTKRNDKLRMADALNDLGKIHYHNYRMKEATNYLLKSKTLYEEIGALRAVSYVYNNLGKVFLNGKDYKKALEFSEKSLAISEKNNDSLAIGESYMVLSNTIHYLGDKARAIEYGKKAMIALKNQNAAPLLLNQAIYMAMWYSEAGQYPKAVDMYDYYIKNRNPGNDTVRQELFRQQVKYDFDKKNLLAKSENERKLTALRSEAERKDFRKNLWLIISVSTLLILSISAYFIYHSYKQKNIIAEQKNKALKQKLLVAQMNPHFIFNSLNAIQNFIFRQDSYHAGIYLKQFSELIRMILDFSRRDLVTLDEEFLFLKNYLELQKLRFNNKLHYEIKIDEQLDMEQVLVTPMLAQPFVENAIEHGIFYKEGEGLLTIKISLNENVLIYEIEDDGIGLEAAVKMKKDIKIQHKSHAIEITKERLEAINSGNNKNIEIVITDKNKLENKTTGVYVKFITPYITA